MNGYNATLSRCAMPVRIRLAPQKYHNPIKSVEDEETNASVVIMILKYDSVAQLVRVPVCQAGGRGFEPRHCRKRIVSRVGYNVALSRRRSRVRVPYGPQMFR